MFSRMLLTKVIVLSWSDCTKMLRDLQMGLFSKADLGTYFKNCNGMILGPLLQTSTIYSIA